MSNAASLFCCLWTLPCRPLSSIDNFILKKKNKKASMCEN